MTGTAADTDLQTRRREAVANARAIVGFAGGVISPGMEALNERYIAGELTGDEVISELVKQLP